MLAQEFPYFRAERFGLGRELGQREVEDSHAGPKYRTAPSPAAAVFVGPDLGGLDVFRKPNLFSREWRKLLRAYAVEAYARPPAPPAPEGKLRVDLHRLLSAAATAPGMVRGNAGVGQIFEFRLEQYRGVALSYEAAIVHAAML